MARLTGKGFELDLARDPAALLGYQLARHWRREFLDRHARLRSRHFIRCAGRKGLIVNDFNALWAAATKRSQDRAKSSARTHAGGAP